MMQSKRGLSLSPGMYVDADPKTIVVAQVASAFASRENSTVAEILELVDGLSRALEVAETGAAAKIPATVDAQKASTGAVPAVPIDQAVKEDKVICLCCGESFTMLKRHLKAEHGLTEDEYRAKFSLPASFPLVAPAYSARKAAYAKKAGLGKHERSTRADSAS